MRPTRGLVPGPGEVTVLARNIDIGQHAAAALTGRDDTDPASRAWPASVRFSAGEHPRIAVPRQRERAGLPQPAQAGFSATVDTLRATGAVVEEISLTAGVRRWRGQPATTLDGFDALVLPLEGTTPALADLVGTLDVAAVAFSDRDAADAAVVTRAFDDQIAIDVVGQLSGIQADTPYPDTGVELAVFGAYLRGQPLNDRLAEVGARFTGFVETAPYYRMVALPGSPPQPGILRAAEGGGPLLAERWVVSEAGLGHFLAGLPAPMTLGSIDLAGGATATGLLCDPVAAAEGTDITAYGCWRAYLRYLSTRRADVPGPRPASG
ncbi:amidase [Prauserella oleivorans]